MLTVAEVCRIWKNHENPSTILGTKLRTVRKKMTVVHKRDFPVKLWLNTFYQFIEILPLNVFDIIFLSSLMPCPWKRLPPHWITLRFPDFPDSSAFSLETLPPSPGPWAYSLLCLVFSVLGLRFMRLPPDLKLQFEKDGISLASQGIILCP